MNSFINAHFPWLSANRPSPSVYDGSDDCNNNIFCITREIEFGSSKGKNYKQYKDTDTDKDTIFSRSRVVSGKKTCSAR